MLLREADSCGLGAERFLLGCGRMRLAERAWFPVLVMVVAFGCSSSGKAGGGATGVGGTSGVGGTTGGGGTSGVRGTGGGGTTGGGGATGGGGTVAGGGAGGGG